MNEIQQILLVEDNKIVGRITKDILLKELNCQVDIAETGKDALELIEQKTYDLILMDIGLPDIDGCTVTEQIRAKTSSPNSKVPIIAVTAHAEEEEKQRFLEVGISRVIIKPLDKFVAQSLLTFLPPIENEAVKSYRQV
jgi:two-component system, OmpR family, aerobic respiration control sensor histidine kinase ArcB